MTLGCKYDANQFNNGHTNTSCSVMEQKGISLSACVSSWLMGKQMNVCPVYSLVRVLQHSWSSSPEPVLARLTRSVLSGGICRTEHKHHHVLNWTSLCGLISGVLTSCHTLTEIDISFNFRLLLEITCTSRLQRWNSRLIPEKYYLAGMNFFIIP